MIITHKKPFLDSIRSFILSYGVSNFFTSAHLSEADGVYADKFDGSTYRNNAFLKRSRKIETLLCQDAFELCICIGSARRNFKLLGIYMAFGNIPKHLQFKSESIIPVALCRNKFVSEFGMESVIKPLIEDIKILEQHGIGIGSGTFFGTVLSGGVTILVNNNYME
jgi:hypothetical protein